jgi:cytosine/adenosine deaminase-related metal-dependent hydrolase
MSVTLIKGAQVPDGTGRDPVSGGGVVVDGTTVRQIANSSALTDLTGVDKVLDFAGCTILPGLIDVHGHPLYGCAWRRVAANVGAAPAGRRPRREICPHQPVLGRHDDARGRRKALYRRGVEHAIERGQFPGPRVLIAPRPLIATNGFGDHLGTAADGPR